MIAAAHDDRAPAYATPPALLDAGEDRALDGPTTKVLLWCHRRLNFDTFERVKSSGAPAGLRFKRQTIGRALRRLVAGGYLEAGPRDGAIPTYRLRERRPEETR